ncbi:glutamate--tRNA ligase [Maudiozyma humilis]|uniref:Glutamate--tRNA ligase, mitochondrial n=1 Tax=Maudiozyma humilis TaxID=51915 RepID=A0AAV5RZS3_MAUHU|nr:glutamate--tRNA ligase [Kazachstania humilis]
MSTLVLGGARTLVLRGAICRGPLVAAQRTLATLHHKQGRKVSVQPTTPVVTRFAPSPTGSLHIGSLRTALYNYLLARRTHGKFILRLEDTDRTRLVPGAEENIYETLQWCGLAFDEGPVKQSERMAVYAKYIQVLLDKGLAYRCFCSKEKLTASRLDGYDRHCLHLSPEEIAQKLRENDGQCIVRFKAPDHYAPFTDLLHGEVNIQERRDRAGHDDPVLLKSDGMPTYHFANVVDDHLMGVTHVVRGEEWLPSTPKHLALYAAFGWAPPQYVHIPLLTSVGTDKKLSKRRNDASVLALQQQGILPEALVNFCALLGWAPPRDVAQQNHECFSLKELETLFSLDHLTRGNVKVDNSKLHFFNKHFLQKRIENPKQLEELVEQIVPDVAAKFALVDCPSLHDKVRHILQDCGHGLTTANEFTAAFGYFFAAPDYAQLSPDAQKLLSGAGRDQVLAVLKELGPDISAATVHDRINAVTEQLGIKKRIVFQSLRLAVAGDVSGAKIDLVLGILGSSEASRRVAAAITHIQRI